LKLDIQRHGSAFNALFVAFRTSDVGTSFSGSDVDKNLHEVQEKIISFTGREVDEMAEDNQNSTKSKGGIFLNQNI